ncbi:Hypothetical predicted protein [Olea europaea subsp. europaea]|uniref:Uncharacterized protein n=1 Tax=Olea europaea subsp. europaea TaxID=158383 RepID=A0A8S0QTM1_OLEEU|nr:Hypothetical predicted protein [Olea europaea subsp. europaea]
MLGVEDVKWSKPLVGLLVSESSRHFLSELLTRVGSCGFILSLPLSLSLSLSKYQLTRGFSKASDLTLSTNKEEPRKDGKCSLTLEHFSSAYPFEVLEQRSRSLSII